MKINISKETCIVFKFMHYLQFSDTEKMALKHYVKNNMSNMQNSI